MIYQMTLRCRRDLLARWEELHKSFDRLHTLIPDGDTNKPVVAGWRTAAKNHIGAEDVDDTLADDLHDAEEAPFPADVNGMIVALQTDFTNSYNGHFRNIRDAALELLTGPAIQDSDAADAGRVAAGFIEGLERLYAEVLDDLAGLLTPEGSRGTVSDIRASVNDFNTFPLLTEQVGSPGLPGGGGGGVRPAGGLGGLGGLVDAAFRDVLGWRPNARDPKGLTAALGQAFVPRVVEGRTEYVYRQPSYASVADIGAVTGAQASIVTRARVILDQALPLVEGLKPLLTDIDDEDLNAITDLVRSTLADLVEELGVEGGPRTQRVDTLFSTLVGDGDPATPLTAEDVTGVLGDLGRLLGLRSENVNTIEEERNLTNFVIVVDYVNSLRQNWESQRGFFDRSGSRGVFLGTQFVLISRAFGAVAESVREAEFTMNSVFVGPAERQTAKLVFPNPERDPPLFVAELLNWVERFATAEAPTTMRASGKIGVRSIVATLTRLRRLVRASLVPPQNHLRLPVGYGRPRVQRAMQELAGHLDETFRLASQIEPRRPAQRP